MGDFFADPFIPWNEEEVDEQYGFVAGDDTIDIGDFGGTNFVYAGNGDDIVFGGISSPGTAAADA